MVDLVEQNDFQSTLGLGEAMVPALVYILGPKGLAGPMPGIQFRKNEATKLLTNDVVYRKTLIDI